MGFGVMRTGEKIDKATIWSDIQVNTEITYKRQLTLCVPFYEEYDAMVDANYNEKEWKKLHYMEKAIAVARYRINNWIGLHSADAEKMKMDQKSRSN